MSKNKPKSIAINVSVEPESVREIRLAINDILSAPCDESTKAAALKALKKSTRIDNVTISGCSIEQRDQ